MLASQITRGPFAQVSWRKAFCEPIADRPLSRDISFKADVTRSIEKASRTQSLLVLHIAQAGLGFRLS